jgi:hypothetical protein
MAKQKPSQRRESQMEGEDEEGTERGGIKGGESTMER